MEVKNLHLFACIFLPMDVAAPGTGALRQIRHCVNFRGWNVQNLFSYGSEPPEIPCFHGFPTPGHAFCCQQSIRACRRSTDCGRWLRAGVAGARKRFLASV